MRTVVGHACAVLAALLVHGFLWSFSFEVFQGSIDFNSAVFEDFIGPYYETARALSQGQAPAPGFLYGPFFGVLLLPLAGLDAVAASWLWLGLQALSIVGIIHCALGLAGRRIHEAATGPAFTFLVLLSFPLVHNLHWGQVGLPLLALVLGAARLQARGRTASAAWILGLASAVKFHPAIFLVTLGADRRAWVHAILALVTLLFVVPALVLGPQVAMEIYASSLSGLEAAASPDGGWSGAANSQYFGSVASRWLGLESRTAQLTLSGVGLAWAGVNVVLAGRRLRVGDRLGAWALLVVSVPLLVYPSWPHYLVGLPFAQLAAWVRRPGDRVGRTAVLASVVISSAPFFRWSGGPEAYGAAGWLLAAHLALLPGLCRRETSPGGPQSSSSPR